MALPPRQVVLALLASLVVVAPAAAKQITIPSTSNIFGAGRTTAPDPGGGGGGSLPTKIKFDAAEGRVMTVHAMGTTYNGTGAPPSDPDGNTETKPVNVFSYRGISGVTDGRQGSLLAVFLGPDAPSSPSPPKYNFSDDMFARDDSPNLRQTFFVGDGLTLTGSGSQQDFKVPRNATRVFFGFADAYGNGPAEAGYYDDNTGSLSATVKIAEPPEPDPPDPPSSDSVAKVVEIKATQGTPLAEIFRNGKWEPLKRGAGLEPGDRIRTRANTLLAFEFGIGGRVQLKGGAEVEIKGDRRAKDADVSRMEVTEGGIWVKCDKLKEPMEIQTNGGAMGIKG